MSWRKDRRGTIAGVGPVAWRRDRVFDTTMVFQTLVRKDCLKDAETMSPHVSEWRV